jgi:hypothetical protein
VSATRPATPDDRRPPNWRPLDERIEELRQAALRAVAAAFAAVRLGDGVSLHETVVIDDGGDAAERQAARRRDPEERWQEVTAATLARVPSALSFLDARGLRFYLPAYMTASLEAGEPDRDLIFALTMRAPAAGEAPAEAPRRATGRKIWWPSEAEMAAWQRERLGLLDQAQGRAIHAYLRFALAIDAATGDDSGARRAIASHWGSMDAEDTARRAE